MVACGCSDPASDEPDPPDPPDPPGPHPSEELFDPAVIVDVQIDIDPADWDALRTQTRSFIDTLAGDCQAQPFEKIFDYYPADIAINGDRVEAVGVRKKGFIGSLSDTKPSLKIKLNEFIGGQEYKGLKRLTLNNQRQDPSLINACLGYSIFRDAGVVAPRCNFARVTVNGAELGIYANVDSIRDEFLEINFDSDAGNLYEGTLSDFRDGWTGTIEHKNNEQTSGADVDQLRAALEAPDADLIDQVSAVVDLDTFYTYWATEALVGHWDGYSGNTNNFYFYRRPGGGLAFIPWGADALFRHVGTYASVQATGLLNRRLYLTAEGRAAYLDRLAELLAGVWDETALAAEVDRMEALLAPELEGPVLANFETALVETRDYIATKRDLVEAELDAGGVDWDQPLREDFCFDQVGTFDLSIDTTWNSGGANPGTGTAEMAITGVTQSVTNIATLAGPGSTPGSAFAALVATLDDGNQLTFLFSLPAAEVGAGGGATIDWVNATGELYLTPPGGAATRVAWISKGQIAVTAGATSDGAPVQLSVSSPVFELGL